ncbi:MAG: YlxR family protein [Sporolactobacillus sp.]
MPKQRKVPMRQCVACQQSFDKRDLFRIVRSPEGDVCLDPTGKKNGRGAYLSKSRECIEKARARHMLSRHLDAEVPDSVFEEMLQALEAQGSDAGKR